MNFQKKILPVIGLLSAYTHFIKPRLLSATAASKGGKSLVLHLCARSRFLIPMIVFTAFYIFDAQMQIGVSVSLTLNRNVRIMLGPEPGADFEDEDDGAGDDDETYTSFASDFGSSIELDDIEDALQDFIRFDTANEGFFYDTDEESDAQ